MKAGKMTGSTTTVSVGFLGFFSLLLLLTLNASNGNDVLDELVPMMAAQTWAIQNQYESTTKGESDED